MVPEPPVEVPAEAEGGKKPRAETFAEVHKRLSFLERFNIGFVRASFERRWLNRILLTCQRIIGAGWVDYCTRNLRVVRGLERLPPTSSNESLIVVSNHRSFFDMFVVNTILFRAGFSQRMLFPVRSNFFYDHPLGFLVNGIMSFWSMYPPVFRDRKRAALNHVAFGELAQALRQEGRSAGIHPEGRRKIDDDPYTFLPAQSGVGRLIHSAHVKVLPVFINGLGNDLKKQVAGNFNGRGRKVVVVFGAPIDFGELLEAPPTAKTYRAIADRTLEAIGALGAEEREIRAGLEADEGGAQPGSSA